MEKKFSTVIALNCSACGKPAHCCSGFADRFDNVFCTKECYHQMDQATHCVARYNLREEVVKSTPPVIKLEGGPVSALVEPNLFYTCDTIQLATQTLRPGQKIDDEGKPAIHESQTQAVLVLEGLATVTVYRDGEAFPLEVGGAGQADKNIIVIPPGVPHVIENKTDVPVILFSIYSPPVHTTC